MAPLFKILVQWLPSLPSKLESPNHGESYIIGSITDKATQQQRPIGLSTAGHGKSRTMDTTSTSQLSTVSSAENRVDVFGLTGNNVTHKFWDGTTWLPGNFELETLGNGLATAPVATTWGVDRLDVFGLDEHNVIKHQYWDGIAWRPNVAEFENLGGACDPNSIIAANTWGQGRLDVFCRGPDTGELLHQYYDGSQWQPSSGSLESLGGSPVTDPSVVSWGENRLDIFALDVNDQVVHLYWDGSQWSEWEAFETDLKFCCHPVAVTSWGENRLDIFAVTKNKTLQHKYWDGSQWADWESLGPEPLFGSVSVTSWAANRLDIVARREQDSHYLYKFYDGEAWRPDVLGWYDKTPGKTFSSPPSSVSWGDNRLDIFGESLDNEWLHQAWAGVAWFPGSTDWEFLGGTLGSEHSLAGQMPVETELRH